MVDEVVSGSVAYEWLEGGRPPAFSLSTRSALTLRWRLTVHTVVGVA